MRRLFAFLVAAAIAIGTIGSAPVSAGASFGLHDFDVRFLNKDGTPATQAGSHPFEFVTSFKLNTRPDSKLGQVPFEDFKDLLVSQIAGLVGNPTAVPRCSTLDFVTVIPGVRPLTTCPDSSAVGMIAVEIERPDVGAVQSPVYNLVPPPGVAAKLGFVAFTVPVTIEAGVNPEPPYNITARLNNIPQVTPVYGSTVRLWGVPGDPAHDDERGSCGEISSGTCPAGAGETPFLTLPRACEGPLATSWETDSWQSPGFFVSGSAITHDDLSPPGPIGMSGCDRLGFEPTVEAKPTTRAAETATGLDVDLKVEDEGITSPAGTAQSDVRKVVLTLPRGMTVNPSSAEGLEVCSEEDLKRETLDAFAGQGCPEASKLGTLAVQTPILEDETLTGSLYLAKPYENPFHSLLALYMVIKDRKLGVIIKQPVKVESDPVTGQLVSTVDDIPQFPLSRVSLHFREGARSPLVSPPTCGSHQVEATLYPYSGGAPSTSTSAFQIISGPDAGPCPSGGTPAFHPGLTAGTINNAAGSYSPFNVRLFRSDSEQEITNFSIKLPPGVTGKLAGIPECSDQQIAAAKAREGTSHGGQEELDNPSCPSATEVGHILAGAGVGSVLTYVPGKVYLAGPYHGSQLSIVAITAAKAGPFDLGTVVVREALRIDPETAEVFVDATGSDPIPHIVNGIPVHLRDIRAYVDRPDFVLNPTSCAPTSVASTVLGSGADFASSADDNPATVTSPFQAADCANLNYHPRLALNLKGGTKRGKNPQLTAILRPRPGDANSKRISVALPHSEFLDQSHIKTICTRVQFKAGDGNGSACPKGSIYGHVRAWTPLLSDPLVGNVYLRSSEHPLPDLVLALHGLVDFTAVGRIDSVKGGIRNTFEAVPDAPISRVEVKFLGGKKGLLINSTNICRGRHRANLEYTAHSGKAYKAKAPLQAKCKKVRKAKKHKRRAKHHRAR